MARKRGYSGADRALDALVELLEERLTIVPFWVGPLLAVLVYLLARFLIPLVLAGPGNPVGGTVATGSKIAGSLLAFLVLMVWVVAEIKKFSNRRLFDTRSNEKNLRSLSWQEFERLVGEAFRRRGYTVHETPTGADGGVDLILTKNGERTFVQCKLWKRWKVGVRAIRELYGVVAAKGAVGGIFVCCGQYTAEAHRFAENQALELIDGPKLWRMIQEVRNDVAGTCSASSPTLREQPPACPKCNSPMVLRTAKQGTHAGSKFFGCSRFPACRGVRPYEAHT